MIPVIDCEIGDSGSDKLAINIAETIFAIRYFLHNLTVTPVILTAPYRLYSVNGQKTKDHTE